MSSLLFKVSLALTTTAFTIPLLTSCQSQSHDSEEEEKSHFLGFQNNEITYEYPKLGEEVITKHVTINRVSQNYYKTSTYVELFVRSNEQKIKFDILTLDPNDSLRAKYYLDNTIPDHSITIMGSTVDYLDEMPGYFVTNPELKYDKLFVNFECDKNVVLEIDCRIWNASYPTSSISMSYSKQSDEDLHYVMFDGSAFQSAIVCPSNGVDEDIHHHLRFICKSQEEYEINKIYVYTEPSADASVFQSCVTYTASCENIIEDNTSYTIVNVDYTILKKLTPTKEQSGGRTPIVFLLRMHFIFDDEHPEPKTESMQSLRIDSQTNNHSLKEYDIGFCNFCVLWQ